MFDIDLNEFLLVAVVALVVIGPKDLPKAMRFVGKWVGKARGVARQFRTGMDTMIRESELADMEKQWAAENERIMRDHPPVPALGAPMAALGEPIDAVMVEQPAFRPESEPLAQIAVEGPTPKPRKRKAPSTGDTIEAPKAAPRKPRAKALS